MRPNSDHRPGWRIPTHSGLRSAIAGLSRWQRQGLAWGRDLDPDHLQPHAYRNFFLHGGVLQRLSPDELGPMALGAFSRTTPAAIRDGAMGSRSTEVQAYLDRHNSPIGVGDLCFRNRS